MGDAYPRVRAAAVQAAPIVNDREACVEKAVALIREAAANGAQLVVFPETWLPGYPFWVWPSSGIERDRGAVRRTFAQLHRNAVEIPSPTTEALLDAARAAGVFVVMGLHERDREYSRGTLYNTLLFIGKDGSILGKHRKLVPTSYERLVWGRGDGSTLEVFETEIGRLSGLICWEHWMPLARYALHAQGEQVHVTVWPSAGEMHQVAARHYAFEGRTFVLSVASYLTPDLLPDNFELREAYAALEGPIPLQAGGTAIIGPDGHYLAGPLWAQEGTLYADLDLGEIAEHMMSFDPAGHYARPDVFELIVHRGKQAAIRTEE